RAGRRAALRVAVGRHRENRRREGNAGRSPRRRPLDAGEHQARAGHVPHYHDRTGAPRDVLGGDHGRPAARRPQESGRRRSQRAPKGNPEAMTRARALAAVVFFAATAAFASWYDDYDAGLDAVRKGQWQTVIQKMTAAINGNPKESDKARTYGAIFI